MEKNLANTGKAEPTMEERNERFAIFAALASKPSKELKDMLLTPGEVSAMLIRSVKTLEKDRTRRAAFQKATREQAKRKLAREKAESPGKAMGQSGDANCVAPAALEVVEVEIVPLDPLHPSSIPFAKPDAGGVVLYFASDVFAYLARLNKSVDRSGLPEESTPPTPTAMRGFQSWLGHATPLETWPFTIRGDGRPVDMAEALATGQLSGIAERLTLREFGAKLADASSAAFHEAEAASLGSPPAVRAPTDQGDGGRRGGRGGPL
jgi:hypothetical protein